MTSGISQFDKMRKQLLLIIIILQIWLNIASSEFCSAPPKIDATFLNSTLDKYDVGAAVKYMCRTGYYSSEGTSLSQCRLSSGKAEWTKATIKCLPRTCPAPDRVSHGKVNTTYYVFTTVITYNCEEGYNLEPTNYVNFCTASGTWAKARPSCNPRDCGTPESLEFGSADYKGTTYGNEVLYKCDAGHQLIGVNVRKCGSDGKWEGVMPECKDASGGICSKPPDSIPHGYMKIFGTDAGNIVVYVCDDGFELVSMCLKDGPLVKWSHPPPNCTAVSTTAPEVTTELLTTTIKTSAKPTTTPKFEGKGTTSKVTTKSTSTVIVKEPKSTDKPGSASCLSLSTTLAMLSIVRLLCLT